MQRALMPIVLLILFFLPAHVGMPGIESGGVRWSMDEAHARLGGMRSFGFRGSRGMFRSRGFRSRGFGSRRSRFGSRRRSVRPIGRSFGRRSFFGGRGFGFGGGFMAGMGGMLLGGMLGRALFGGMGYGGGMGGGAGGIGLLEILLIGGGIFLLFRFLRNRAAPAYSRAGGGYGASDPYGVGDPHEREEGYGGGYRGPDIGPRGSDYGRGTGPVAATYSADSRAEEGLPEISRADSSFSRENFLLDCRENFLTFQKAWVARDLEPIRSTLDKDILSEFERDLDALRREGRINKLDNVEIRRIEIVESWQEEGFDFITVSYEASLLDYVVSESTGKVVEGNPNTPVNFTEYWTWARKSGPGSWFLSAISQG
jgi:predicted lipid-binding transport protein (Tim44 family)